MANLNKVMLMGNITRDLDLKYLPSNTAVCDFGLAINRNWTGPDGVKKEEVTFVDCTAFGKTAELLSKYKKKGDPLFVEGRLKLDQWEKDGAKHSRLKVIVENFQFLNRSSGPGGAPAPQHDGGEYTGEPTQSPAAAGGGSGYAPRQQTPRPAPQSYNRAPGRPAPQTAQTGGPQPAPDYDAGDSIPEDSAPAPIKDDDIPF